MPHSGRFLILFLLLIAAVCAAANDLDRELHDKYSSKTLVLRGFYVGDHLQYDSSGALVSGNPSGDWTSEGFVQISNVDVKGHEIRIKARRMSVVSLDRTFTLRAAENEIVHPHVDKTIVVEIAADLGTHNPSPDQADAAMAKIFLADKDDLVNLLPDYWKPCVQGGRTGKDESCHFAPEMLSIPGLAGIETEKDASVSDTSSERKVSPGEQFRVGHGVSAPKLLEHREPEYSELARRMKYQGTVVLGLVVNQDGVPSNIHVIRPLGCGLDAQAVQAVGGWRFKPAEKDERPVAVVISVEVTFHVR